MLPRLRQIGVVIVMLSVVENPRLHGEAGQPLDSDPQFVNYLKDAHSSMNRLLYELALERHAAISKRHEVWVFSLHRGLAIKKYTDGKITLVSLPMTIPTDGIAMRLYVNKCNLLNIQVADSLVNSGEYVKARELLALLAKVTEGDRLMEIDLEQRLNLLAKIEPSKPDPEVLSRYAKLHEVFDSLLNLATLDSITATPVKDLREVNPRD